MPSYVVTGASRGIGFEFVRQISQDRQNTTIALARNKVAAEAKFAKEGIDNVHVVEAQYTDFASLKRAADEVKEITNGSLDYLINNAGYISLFSQFLTFSEFEDDLEALEKDIMECFEVNLLGVIKATHAFLPLIRKGKEKKVISLTSGFAELDLTNNYEIASSTSYSISKSALNMAMAKYNACYKQEGILFLSIAPGTAEGDEAAERRAKLSAVEAANAVALMKGFAAYAPDFTGPWTFAQSASAVLSVMHKKSLAGGDGGAAVSQFGNKQWL
ncbi:hypothetical protein FQN51_005897 [Onygenales sp. PD_10]|nr:hypothetical protein FQN51_005897 [Onygenales sp. PD_10]